MVGAATEAVCGLEERGQRTIAVTKATVPTAASAADVHHMVRIALTSLASQSGAQSDRNALRSR